MKRYPLQIMCDTEDDRKHLRKLLRDYKDLSGQNYYDILKSLLERMVGK